MRTKHVVIEVEVLVTVSDEDAIERVTGPGGDEWRENLYPLSTEDEVLEHVACCVLGDGYVDASELDGWADLPEGAMVASIIAVVGTQVLPDTGTLP